MGNGGSPPAHLSSSSLSDPSWWLQFKWSQPPPPAPEWLFKYYDHYKPPANVGRPLCVEGWLQRAIREDQQAAGLLPPAQPGGPIRLGARARAEHAYRDWKAAIDDLWEDEHHRLCLIEEQAARARQEEDARRQKLLNAQAARACQEAAARARQEETAARARQEEPARRQRAAEARKTAAAQIIFLWLRLYAARARHKETAARARQEEAARRQKLLDEQAARARQEAAARARQEEASRRHQLCNKAAQTIFLWFRRRRLHVRLTRQTARRQYREAAVARLRYEDACHKRAALAEAKRREDALADKQRCHKAVLAAQADKLRRHEAVVLAAQADKQRRHEAMLAKAANEQR